MTAPSPFPYVRETLELLGDRDTMGILAETPGWIAVRVEGLTNAQMRTPEAPGKWSLAEVFAHLTDAEVAYAWRLRLILTQDRPPLQGYDQNAWVRRFDYVNADPGEALETFSMLRRWNLRVWKSATAADLDRLAIHSERGPESLDLLRRLTAGHDLRHRRQIERLLKVVR